MIRTYDSSNNKIIFALLRKVIVFYIYQKIIIDKLKYPK